MRILVCGGAGFIGSHTCVALVESGHEVVALDNLSNGSIAAIERVRALTGRNVKVIHADVRNRQDMESALSLGIDSVIHFAALKAVGESCAAPLRYFDNNIGGTISLLQAMESTGVSRLVFSSSATVYRSPAKVPVPEDAPLGTTNPYGRTKLVAEQLIGDFSLLRPDFSAILLRYFNPVGAHPSGRIGEDPLDTPNNLMPIVCRVAIGRMARLKIFGNDYPTPDGTAIRDYIHVMDLATAHERAVEKCNGGGCRALNVGCGRGYSVLELVRAFEAASGRPVPFEYSERRQGDVAEMWADTTLTTKYLEWTAKRSLPEMCEDAWRWQFMNPDGYR